MITLSHFIRLNAVCTFWHLKVMANSFNISCVAYIVLFLDRFTLDLGLEKHCCKEAERKYSRLCELYTLCSLQVLGGANHHQLQINCRLTLAKPWLDQSPNHRAGVSLWCPINQRNARVSGFPPVSVHFSINCQHGSVTLWGDGALWILNLWLRSSSQQTFPEIRVHPCTSWQWHFQIQIPFQRGSGTSVNVFGFCRCSSYSMIQVCFLIADQVYSQSLKRKKKGGASVSAQEIPADFGAAAFRYMCNKVCNAIETQTAIQPLSFRENCWVLFNCRKSFTFTSFCSPGLMRGPVMHLVWLWSLLCMG